MFVAKGLLVLVPAALAVALVRFPGHSRARQSHYSVLGRRLWRFEHPPPSLLRFSKHSTQLIPSKNIGEENNEIEALNKNYNEAKELLFPNDKNNINILPNPLSKRNDNEDVQYYTPKCVCPEEEGYYDLGPGHYPRHIYGKECAPDGVYKVRPEYFLPMQGGPTNCQDNDPDFECCQPNVYCKQINYPAQVLTRRPPTSSNYEVKGEDSIPPEFKSEWKFSTFNVSTACILMNPN